MGLTQSDTGSPDKKNGPKLTEQQQIKIAENSHAHFKKYLDELYPSALNRVLSELPFIKQAYDHIMKTDKIQDQQRSLSKLLFKKNIWNAHYSMMQLDDFDRLASAIFNCYTPYIKGSMQFEHFVCMYATLTCPENEEEAYNLVFRLYCKHPPQFDEETQEYCVTAGRFQQRGMSLFSIDRNHASNFFSESLNITKDINISQSQMKMYFDCFRQDLYFKWIDLFKISYKGTQNAQESIIQSSLKVDEGLLESDDFTQEEYKALEEFFDNKIARNTDILESTKHFMDLISDRSIDLKLKNRIVESFLFASDSNLYYDKKVYFKIMRLLFKERNEKVLINFIFDMFTKYSKTNTMDQKQVKECFQVFRKQVNMLLRHDSKQKLINEEETPGQEEVDEDEYLNRHLNQIIQMERNQFVEIFSEYLDFKQQFSKIRTILYCELGVRPENGAMEREIIKTILDGKLNFSEFFIKHMKKGDRAFIVDKKFITSWEDYTKSKKSKRDKEGQLKIDNSGLFKIKNEVHQNVQLKLNENIEIIPPRIWQAFVRWYGQPKEIKRGVVEYPNTPETRANYNPNNPRKLTDDRMFFIEFEIDMMGIFIAKVLDNGAFPEKFQICYISPRMTLNDVKLQVCNYLRIQDPSKTQLWMKDELLQGEDILQSTVETNKQIKSGKKFFLECMLENQRWPTEEKQLKKAQKSTLQDMKTVGCYNLGNTCYINSAIQCVANTHYFKDFFLRHVFFDNKDFKINENVEGGDWKFVPSKPDLIYSNQINISNPMGNEGRIVSAFAALIQDMYISKFACVNEPKKFKRIMGRYHEQFSGKDQQDAQEFLVILLDSLHEELNIRMTKPYFEKPSSQGRDPEELAVQCWSNFLHRNWSFIVFLFYGQMRSLLKCNECDAERLSFDEFSTLSLPLPESSLINFKIVIQLLPHQIKQILENGDQDLFNKVDMEHYRRKETMTFDAHEDNIQLLVKERMLVLRVSLLPSTQMTTLTKHISKTYPNLNLIIPQKHSQGVDDNLCELIYYLNDFNGDPQIIVPPETSLMQIVEGTTIFATEVLTLSGKNLVQDFYTSNWNQLISQQGNLLLNFFRERDSQGVPLLEMDEETQIMIEEVKQEHIMISPKDKIGMSNKQNAQFKHYAGASNIIKNNSNYNQYQNLECEAAIAPEDDLFKVKGPQPIDDFEIIVNDDQFEQIDTRSKRDNVTSDEQFRKQDNRKGNNISNMKFETVQLDTEYFQFAAYQLDQQNRNKISYSQFTAQKNKNHQQGIDYKVPNQFLIFLKSRKIMVRPVFFTKANQYYTSTFGRNVMFLVNSQTNGRQIYEETWMKTRYMLNLTQQKFFEDPHNLWWNNSSNSKSEKSFVPFIIKFVKTFNSDSQSCSLCGKSEYCLGCPLEPEMTSKQLFEQLQFNSTLAIDWNMDFLSKYYNENLTESIDVNSLKDTVVNQQSDVKLTDCLKMFESVEEIPIKEGVKCEKCKKPTAHSRKMGVQKTPPILIIQLKRFKIINQNKRKIDQYINFPLYDLDMSPFLQHNEERKASDEKYDLYAIINHYGSINGGHYTSFVKNERTNTWFQYDDSYVKEILESKVRSQFAYILFYKRQDIMKKPLESVYQSISIVSQDYFRGKPCRLKKQFGSKLLGYLWDRRIENGQVIYHVKFDSIDFFTTADMLDFDQDQDNISHLIRERDVNNGKVGNDEDDNEEESKQESKPGEAPKKKKNKTGFFKQAQKCANQ